MFQPVATGKFRREREADPRMLGRQLIAILLAIMYTAYRRIPEKTNSKIFWGASRFRISSQRGRLCRAFLALSKSTPEPSGLVPVRLARPGAGFPVPKPSFGTVNFAPTRLLSSSGHVLRIELQPIQIHSLRPGNLRVARVVENTRWRLTQIDTHSWQLFAVGATPLFHPQPRPQSYSSCEPRHRAHGNRATRIS